MAKRKLRGIRRDAVGLLVVVSAIAGSFALPTEAVADTTVHASIADAAAVEGPQGKSTSMKFTVTLDAARSSNTRFLWASFDGSATDGSDYRRKAGAVSVPAGLTTGTFSVQVIGDNDPEFGSEFFTVQLATNTPGVTIDDAQAIGTIVDDDPISFASVSIGDAAVVEGDEGTQLGTLNVTLSKPLAAPITVAYHTEDRSAIAPADYRAVLAGLLTIPAGKVSMPITVRLNTNTTPETDRSLAVVLDHTSGPPISRPTGTLQIIDDDDGDHTGVSIGDAAAVEGDNGKQTLTFVVTLSSPAAVPATLAIAVVPGSATANVDYVRPAPTLRIPAGRRTIAYRVSVRGDTLPEGDEQFDVVITSTGSSGIPIADGTGTGRIIENDYSIVAPDAPTAPQNVAVATASDVGAGWVRATWTRPIYNGSSVVTSYFVTYTDGAGTTDHITHFVEEPTLDDTFFCGTGSTCRVKVNAVNLITAGPYSSLSNAVTP